MDDLSQYIYINKTQSSQNIESSEEIELLPENIQIVYNSAENPPVVYQERIDQPELLDLLTNWGVPILYRKCIDEEINLDILKIMTSRHAELLTKEFKLGVLVKFENNLKNWQISLNSTVSSSLSENALAEPSNKSFYSQSLTDIPDNRDINLEHILQQTTNGISLLENCKNGIELNDGCRTILLDTIINHLIQNKMKMSTKLAENISDEIVSVFPKEIKTFYFLKESGKAPKGRIYSKYFNQLRSLKSCGLLGKRTYTDTKEETFDRCLHPDLNLPEEDNIEEHLDAIKKDNSSWPEIETHYAATAKFRLAKIAESSSTLDIFNRWNHYKCPLGFKLIDCDFKVLHPNSPNLVQCFGNVSEKIFQIIEQKIRDNSSLSLFKEWKQIQNPTENGRYATILYLLHAVLVPTSKSVKVERGKKVHIKYSIKDSQNSFMIVGRTLEEAEAELRQKLQKKVSLQPLIMITGSVLNPEDIVLYFDGVKFKFFSILSAVDICFKIYIVFNLEYPIESKLIWSFIQKFFYNLSIKSEIIHPNVSFLCSQLDHT